jgi:hypothetical protein
MGDDLCKATLFSSLLPETSRQQPNTKREFYSLIMYKVICHSLYTKVTLHWRPCPTQIWHGRHSPTSGTRNVGQETGSVGLNNSRVNSTSGFRGRHLTWVTDVGGCRKILFVAVIQADITCIYADFKAFSVFRQPHWIPGRCKIWSESAIL